MSEPDWKRYGYASYEAFIESKAGACPPESYLERQARLAGPQAVEDCANDGWPQPKPPPFPADDENQAEPDE